VTQNILEEHGSWEFDELGRWTTLYTIGKKRTLDTGNVYVPITLTGDMVDIMDSPTTPDDPPDLELHSDVQLFLDGRKDHIEHPSRKLYLAEDIAVRPGLVYDSEYVNLFLMQTEEVRQDRVDSALLMPVAYNAILDLHKQKMHARKRNQDAGLDQDHEELLPTSSPLRQHEA
jgi:hypothetical protein